MQSRRSKQIRATVAITLVVTALLWFFGFSGRLPATENALAKLQYTTCDGILFGWRGFLPTPPEIVIVAIDSDSIKNLQAWPFPRSYHAELIRRLKAMGAKVIAFDVVMDVGHNDEADRELVDACREAGNVIMGAQQAAVVDPVGGKTIVQWMLPFAELAEVTAIGTVNFDPEADGVVRRARVGHEVADLHLPLLSILATARYLGLDAEKLVQGDTLQVGQTRVELDRERKFWINYIGKQGAVRTCSYYQVVPPPGESIGVPADYFKDKLVFVGATDPLLHDVVPSPYEPQFPGVTVHANIASMLLHNQPLRRVSGGWAVLLAALFSLLISGVAVAKRPTWALAWLVALILCYAAAAAAVFARMGVWIPVVAPFLGGGGAFVGGVLYRWLVEERERKRIGSLFSKYVSRDVARALMDDPEAAQLGRSRKLPVTCLFSDIRGFTTMSERLSPEEVVAMLNEYFDRMVACVFENDGTLDKYMGDAIMATYGVPKSFGNDAERACRTALRMREELVALQEKWEAQGRTGIDIGIGINTGDAIVGNIGHHDRMEFTVIGDSVNTACRLESANKELQTHILISQSTWDEVEALGIFTVRRLPPIHVKGKAEAVQIYELLGWAKPGERHDLEPEPAASAAAE